MGGKVSAPTIDPSEAIGAFHSAADVIRDQYPEAFKQLQDYTSEGTRQYLDQLTKAEGASLPFSKTALDSMNELRRFMGMQPVSKSIGIAGKIRAAGEKLLTPRSQEFGLDNVGTQLTTLADQFEQAESITDPTQREATKAELSKKINDIYSGLRFDYIESQNLRNAGDYKPFEHGLDEIPTNINQSQALSVALMRNQGMSSQEATAAINKLKQLAETDQAAAQEYLNQLRSASGSDRSDSRAHDMAQLLENPISDLAGARDEFEQLYDTGEQRPYTGEEVKDFLTELPEYQFQLEQGNKLMQRSQAARGTLQSGEALLEAQQFGQGLAQNVYSGHLSRLAGLAGLNLPQVSAQQGILSNIGNTALGTQSSLGAAQLQSLQGIANARANAYNQQGKALFDAQKLNAQNSLQAGIANQNYGLNLFKTGAGLLGGLF